MEDTVMNNAPETTETAPVNEGTPDFDDDAFFDDIDLSDIKADEAEETGNEKQETPAETEDQPEADQQKETEPEQQEQEDGASDEQKSEETQEGENQPFMELKRFGEVTKVNREQATVLAQKGLDYDHVRGERDTAKERVAELEGFLTELAAPSNMSIEDLMDATRAELLANKEGIDQSVALQRVKLDRERKAFDAQKQNAQREELAKQEQKQRIDADNAAFQRAFPNVKMSEVPKEVWEMMLKEGESLVSSYARFTAKALAEENEKLKSDLETAKQNFDNKQRSTGSQKSAGNAQKKSDPIDDDWYSGD